MTSARCLPDTVLRRVSNTLRFCWVLLSALLDSLTAWLRGLCQEHIDISTVLRLERSMLMQQAKQVGGAGSYALQPSQNEPCPPPLSRGRFPPGRPSTFTTNNRC